MPFTYRIHSTVALTSRAGALQAVLLKKVYASSAGTSCPLIGVGSDRAGGARGVGGGAYWRDGDTGTRGLGDPGVEPAVGPRSSPYSFTPDQEKGSKDQAVQDCARKQENQRNRPIGPRGPDL